MDLCSDARRIIMALLVEYDTIGAVMLACTCWEEWRLYMQLRTDTMVSFRSIMLDIWSGEGNLAWNNRTKQHVIPGEHGYAYFKKRDDLRGKKFWRREFFVYMKARERRASKATLRYEKHQLHKGVYDL